MAAADHQLDAGAGIKNTAGVERHQLPQAVASEQFGLAALLMQQIHQAALHHKQGRLGVARVVEVAQLTAGLPSADGGQIAA